MLFSNLLQSLPQHHPTETQAMIAEQRAAGVDVIDLSAGDPDLPAPEPVIEQLCAALHESENHRYPEYRGMHALHEAIAAWFERRFAVHLETECEILPLLGSKEGLVYTALTLLSAGSIALVPDPGYAVYSTASIMAGASLYFMQLTEENAYFPDLEAIPPETLKHARLLWLNYPHNPTGACASRAFFEKALAFARRHQLVIVNDMAYAEVYYENSRPLSLLQLPGARKVAVELHSLSKAYNMAGFRLGMLVGNHELVDAVGRLKRNVDCGIFRPLQYAAITALHLPLDWVQQRNALYQHRRDLLVEACNALGLATQPAKAGLYVWARIPPGFTSRTFSRWLLERSGVFVTPGSNFGRGGEGWVRISLTVPDERLIVALERIKAAMQRG
ncbi:aminotransferase class I/II-fold pyridoxal phosphate-dependent enzyme [Ktedonosporobacter rubrisoli]|uniref:Aminotransferase n=1 Tax=Ktedonosporobacter rubrisoli TaxID=2509675 RepID=A0A4P6JNY2_KTERU|nr:aminotransferase class I/II-fold pyridoxal phosphate-dependent enzyme [Ktedonosporobacter rubrisoli]QBD77047.1 aminotransferase class I/II-fold pyridoxal phosphate-dependent enzyme [Ktedonosporobacter rubrisoli]